MNAVKTAENFQVSPLAVEQANLFFQGVNTWLCESEIGQIWSDDPSLVKHLARKWDSARIGTFERDVWRFYDSLDPDNKNRLVQWYNDKMVQVVSKRKHGV
jgi:hypothetical protein